MSQLEDFNGSIGSDSQDTRDEGVQVHFSFVTRRMDINVNEAALFNAFRPFAEIIGVVLKAHRVDEATRTQHGYGFGFYNSLRDAEHVVKMMRGRAIDGVIFDCSISKRSEERYRGVGGPSRTTLGRSRHSTPRLSSFSSDEDMNRAVLADPAASPDLSNHQPHQHLHRSHSHSPIFSESGVPYHQHPQTTPALAGQFATAPSIQLPAQLAVASGHHGHASFAHAGMQPMHSPPMAARAQPHPLPRMAPPGHGVLGGLSPTSMPVNAYSHPAGPGMFVPYGLPAAGPGFYAPVGPPDAYGQQYAMYYPPTAMPMPMPMMAMPMAMSMPMPMPMSMAMPMPMPMQSAGPLPGGYGQYHDVPGTTVPPPPVLTPPAMPARSDLRLPPRAASNATHRSSVPGQTRGFRGDSRGGAGRRSPRSPRSPRDEVDRVAVPSNLSTLAELSEASASTSTSTSTSTSPSQSSESCHDEILASA